MGLRLLAKKRLCLVLVIVSLMLTFQKISGYQLFLSIEEMLVEIEYVADLIRRVHSDPFHSHSHSQEEFERLVKQLAARITTPLKRRDFFFILNQLTHFIGDAHTYLDNPFEQWFIPVEFYWAVDGLVVIKAGKGCGLEYGDKALIIGDKNPASIFMEMEGIISAENSFRLKGISAEKLVCGSYLEYLGLLSDNAVKFIVEDINGKTKTVWVQLEPLPLFKYSREFCGWRVELEYSLGYFYLDECVLNSSYRSALEGFFRTVNEYRIEKVALDLRRNGGGNPAVINEFLRYLPVRLTYHWGPSIFSSCIEGYGFDIRFSPEAVQQRGYSQSSGYVRYNPALRPLGVYRVRVSLPPEHKLLFKGSVYVMISNRTYSAANIFAVTLQDNHLGIQIGEPTGNQPSNHGDSLVFQTQYSEFNLYISHMKFYRPDTSKDPSDACYPDIYIPTTVKDIRECYDPQFEYLKKIIQY